MKGVIVTGGTGFVGSTLVNRLRKTLPAGVPIYAPSSKEVDLVQREATFNWFERLQWTNEISHLFHLAAVYKAGGWPATHPATQFYANMQINLNLLEAWKRFYPKARLTSVVSYCMYPDHDKPHDEEELWGTEPEPYLFAYAFTKKALLIGQRAYVKEHGMEASALVLPTVYGAHDDFSEMSHVMGALIGKFVRAVDSGEPSVEVWGDGTQEREFIHVEDVADALLLIAQSPIQSDIYNIGTPFSTTIRELAEIISEKTGFKGHIEYNTDRFVGALKRVLNSRLIQKEMGWQPKIDLAKGVGEVIDWYRQSK